MDYHSSRILHRYKTFERDRQCGNECASRAPLGVPEFADPADQLLCSIQAGDYSPRQLALLQHADPDVLQIVLLLQGFRAERSTPVSRSSNFILHEGVLYKKNCVADTSWSYPPSSTLHLLYDCQNSPNGTEKTLAKLSQRYWCKTMNYIVKCYVSTCEFCQPFKSRVGYAAGKLFQSPLLKKFSRWWQSTIWALSRKQRTETNI